MSYACLLAANTPYETYVFGRWINREMIRQD